MEGPWRWARPVPKDTKLIYFNQRPPKKPYVYKRSSLSRVKSDCDANLSLRPTSYYEGFALFHNIYFRNHSVLFVNESAYWNSFPRLYSTKSRAITQLSLRTSEIKGNKNLKRPSRTGPRDLQTSTWLLRAKIFRQLLADFLSCNGTLKCIHKYQALGLHVLMSNSEEIIVLTKASAHSCLTMSFSEGLRRHCVS